MNVVLRFDENVASNQHSNHESVRVSDVLCRRPSLGSIVILIRIEMYDNYWKSHSHNFSGGIWRV